MSETSEALKSLGAFPLVQAALFAMVVLAGIWVFLRGTRERNGGNATSSVVPPWILMGPGHDAIGAIHDLAEQSRNANEILRTIAHEERQQTQLLEDILNNQIARGDINPPPVKRKHPL